MTGRRLTTGGLVLLLFAGLLLAAAGTGAALAGEKTYRHANIRGRLVDPETGKPMVGATVRFIDTSREGNELAVRTDEDGRFEARNLPFGIYVLEITTAEGDKIQGVNTLPLRDGKGFEVEARISRRANKSLGLENRPIRFAVWTEKKRNNMRRFWKQFFAFWATAIAGFAAM